MLTLNSPNIIPLLYISCTLYIIYSIYHLLHISFTLHIIYSTYHLLYISFTLHISIYQCPDVVTKYKDRISAMEKDIDMIELQEKEEKEMRSTENQMNKAKNILEHKQTEMSEKRTWFQTHKERLNEKGT